MDMGYLGNNQLSVSVSVLSFFGLYSWQTHLLHHIFFSIKGVIVCVCVTSAALHACNPSIVA